MAKAIDVADADFAIVDAEDEYQGTAGRASQGSSPRIAG